MNKKYDQKSVSALFSVQGCELLGDYATFHEPVEYRCSCGSISKISLPNFKKGARCQDCGIRKISGEAHYRYLKNREEYSMRRKISSVYRSALRNVLKSISYKKEDKTENIMGYTAEELRTHIENHPNWGNVKNTNWHLDHIFPITAFIDCGIEEISLINSLENLRPITSTENLVKNNHFNKSEFVKWLNERGWFSDPNGKYSSKNIVYLGNFFEFLLPTKKETQVKEVIHDTLVEMFSAYTVETTSAYGFWLNDNHELIQDTNSKYVVSYKSPSKLGLFIDFLSEICSRIEEDCIYINIETNTFLIKPKI